MVRFGSVAAVATALLLGAAANAHAAELRTSTTPATATERPRTTADLAEQPTQTAPWTLAPRKTLQWDSNGKWGLRLGIDQPSLREPDWKDVKAGAFFRITPSLRVGGSVQLGDRLSSPKQVTPSDAAAPRVHLETAFRF